MINFHNLLTDFNVNSDEENNKESYK